MRLLEYVEISEQKGEPIVIQGAWNTAGSTTLVQLHEGVRIYMRASHRQDPHGMRATTLIPLLTRIPRLLSSLIKHAHVVSVRPDDANAIIGLYTAHFIAGEGLTLSKQDTIAHFALADENLNDLLLEVDARSKTIASLREKFQSLIREDFAKGEVSEADAEGAGWPSDLPASVAKRKELLEEGWPTSSEVASLLGSNAGNQAQHAAALRQAGKLLGVRDGARGFRHPVCQFRQGELIEEIEALLTLLPPGNKSGWSQAFWLYSPNAFLEGRRPADVLRINPAQVIEAAKKQFEATEHASW